MIAADATLRADAPASEKAESQNKEVRSRLYIGQTFVEYLKKDRLLENYFSRQTRRAVQDAAMPPAAQVGLVKSVYVGAVPAVKTIVVPAPTATAPAQGAGQAVDTVTTVGEQ